MKGILGRKLGMTQVFTQDGDLIPVTVIEASPNVVLQIKTPQTDGYSAVQLGFEDKREKVTTKPELGHTKKAGTTPKRFIREIRDCELEVNVGDEVAVDIFAPGEQVDVIGTSKGKGFQGSIKRHGHHLGPASHGSGHHRHVGSLATNGITSRQGRIIKGTKMPGRMGGERVTAPNLTVIKVDKDNNYILIKGNVPGPKRGMVMVRNAKKSKGNKEPVTLIDYSKEES